MDMLDGIFSFVLLNTRDNSFMVARDAIGITSLYIGWGLDGKHSFKIPFSFDSNTFGLSCSSLLKSIFPKFVLYLVSQSFFLCRLYMDFIRNESIK